MTWSTSDSEAMPTTFLVSHLRVSISVYLRIVFIRLILDYCFSGLCFTSFALSLYLTSDMP